MVEIHTSAEESACINDSSAPDGDCSSLSAIPPSATIPCCLAQDSLKGIPVSSEIATPAEDEIFFLIHERAKLFRTSTFGGENGCFPLERHEAGKG